MLLAVVAMGGMMQLVEALHILGRQGEIDLTGRCVKLAGERCTVYVAELAREAGYCTWCDRAEPQSVEVYPDPIMAIYMGWWYAQHHQCIGDRKG